MIKYTSRLSCSHFGHDLSGSTIHLSSLAAPTSGQHGTRAHPRPRVGCLVLVCQTRSPMRPSYRTEFSSETVNQVPPNPSGLTWPSTSD
eukprot:4698141-Amphidinium_carterae.2